jgi:hypothetical protein
MHEMEANQRQIIASAFIVKAIMLALSCNVSDETFLFQCSDLYNEVEKNPAKFVKLEKLADEAQISTSLSKEELKDHLGRLEAKCSAIRERLSNV